MTGGWALTIVSLLCAAEVVLDKIPLVDSANDLVQTFIRPAAGGAVMVASTAAGQLDDSIGSSTFLAHNPWVGWVLGIAVALGVHATKMTVRPIANTGTLGTAAPVLSTAEDLFSLGMSFIAIIAPVIGLLFMIALMFAAIRLIAAARRRKARRGTRFSQG
jgi:FtsH-binding integral membrane protein